MTPKELLAKFNFHDSLVNLITFENKTITIYVDFCFWKQTTYNEEQNETGLVKLVFNNVNEYNGPTGKIDDFSIVNIEEQNGILILLLCDDFNSKYYELSIDTDEVIFEASN